MDDSSSIIIPQGTRMNIYGVPFVAAHNTPFQGRKSDLDFVRKWSPESFQDVAKSEIAATKSSSVESTN